MLEAAFPTCVCMHGAAGAVPRGLGAAAGAFEAVEVPGVCRSLQFFSLWQKKKEKNFFKKKTPQRHRFAVLN